MCPFPSRLAEVIRSSVHGDASSKCQNWGRVATAPLPRALLCHSGSLVPLHYASSRRVAELLPHTSRPPWQRVTLCKAWPSHYPPLQYPTHSQGLLFGVLPLLVQTPATRRAKKGESVLSLNGSPLGPVATTALSTPAVAVELSTGHVITTAEASVCVCVECCGTCRTLGLTQASSVYQGAEVHNLDNEGKAEARRKLMEIQQQVGRSPCSLPLAFR